MPRNNKDECCCEKPDRLRGKPEKCAPDQVKECHGEGAEHRCCHSRENAKHVRLGSGGA
jgi:hypothetical protein